MSSISHLIFTTTLSYRYDFVIEETGLERLDELPEVSQLVNDLRAGIRP